ncbi:MAG: hypothetical protein IID33_15095, partial [Planctomycetes bacterium]|nr:hypothetical protein [Planctomycetota bacterium]
MIAVTWCVAWRIGRRLCRALGVVEHASQWALACIVPTAGLILSVHVMAMIALATGQGVVTPEPVAAIFALVAWLAHRCTTRAKTFAPGASPPRHVADRTPLGLWVAFAVLAGAYVVFFVDALTRYPMGYDALYYHLPVAVRWMHEQRLDLVVGFNYLSHPENGMIVPFLLAFAKLESLFPFVHLPKAALVGLAIYGLARSINVSEAGAKLTACIALSVPIVMFQSFSGYIDLYAASAWLSALLALTWAVRASDPSCRHGMLVLAGLAAGVALGSKTTFLVMVTMLAVVAMAVEWIRSRESLHDRRSPVRNLLLFGAASLACSGFWFVRGTVQAGNPVYPLGVEVGGTTLLPGLTADDIFPRRSMSEKISRWWNYPWRETKYSGTGYPYSVNNGLGAAYTAFVPLGLLAVGLALLLKSSTPLRGPPGRWLFIFTGVALTGVVLHMTVFREMLRFVLPQLLLAIVVSAVLIDRLMARFPTGVWTLAVIAFVATGLIATAKPARTIATRIKNDVWDRALYYGIPSVIDELPPGSRIVNTADPGYNYPLLGRKLSNTVIGGGVWRTKLCPRGLNAHALRENRVEYLFVQEPWPSDWDDNLPIELISDNTNKPRRPGVPASRVYRVVPEIRLGNGRKGVG